MAGTAIATCRRIAIGMVLPALLGSMLLPAWLGSLALAADAADTAGVEFFETRVRPVLVEHCGECHGANKQEGSLRLDHPAGILAGGDRGPVVMRGEPDKSRLVQAIRYLDEDLQMPPRGKLAQRQIDDLTQWVHRGAPMPKVMPSEVVKPTANGFDLKQRMEHWCYQPVKDVIPPDVRDTAWPLSPVDRFILAKLEAASLRPASIADRRTLIRRLSFDLTGLPPSEAEVTTFLADTSPKAYEKLVDRLLASPHYGERWARHWLDLVRYAETLGHEFDFELFHAWRYRDYVIRALNADVPYNQFVLEHLAGDLLPEPRYHPIEGFNESIIGTGFWWLGEGKHSPVDIRQEQADRIDNQIDVFGKTFLAQTIACARCHDHKFDAITAADYYALAGYLKSTRYDQASIDPPQRIEHQVDQLRSLHDKVGQIVRPRLKQAWSASREQLPALLLVTAQALTTPDANIERLAAETSLDLVRLQRWIDLFKQSKEITADHPFYTWRQLAIVQAESDVALAQRSQQWREALVARQAEAARAIAETTRYASGEEHGFDDWLSSGAAFQQAVARSANYLVGNDPHRPILRWLSAGQIHSGQLARRLEGALRSPAFTIEQPLIHLRAAGHDARINLVIDGHVLIRSPIYGGLTINFKDDKERVHVWHTIDVSMWQGKRAYFELLDCSVPNPTQPLPAANRPREFDGYLALDAIHFSPHSAPPAAAPSRINLEVLADPVPTTIEELAERYTDAIDQVVTEQFAAWNDGEPGMLASSDVTKLLNLLTEAGLFDAPQNESLASLQPVATAIDSYRRLAESLPLPVYALAAADGSGEDECVFHRGNYRALGDRVPRRLPQAICTTDQPPPQQGSGRLEMARRLVDPANPLLARVMVNRLWQHHFGQGIVRSPDDFGRMGQPPTHPELLDYLAGELVERGWSLKEMHRLMLVSRTYQMASRGDAAAETADPENKLWHRMPIRRLEAEAIRDAVLAVSGQLKPDMYGPSVLPHLTPFMEGRGRPAASGPLDGDRRRSLYINVRRNFLTPMFLAFDYPIPFSTMGRRSVSNVPAQALAMMNGPFVVEQARHWAAATLADGSLSPADRIRRLYQTAFARPATDEELAAALEFIEAQSKQSPSGDDQTAAWTELCHVLLNTKEFIFVD